MRVRASSSVLPLWAKLAYTAFVAVLVPHYWQAYGPSNFLYFCDIALLLTCLAMWTESALLASACAVGILLPQFLWMIDFIGTWLGLPVTGMTGYMFQDAIPLFARFLSFFHFWLPLVLLWLVIRLGYDRRGLWLWWALAWAAMWASYLFLPMPPAPASNPGLPVNVNYVFGINDKAPQTWMLQQAFFALMLTALPALIWVPTHLVLHKTVRIRA
ncbi:membrane protein [Aquabacterium sp. NJ1]|uniref:hypothetical protein n=1 Tax=Aquabacterium sp. NJ1 TaxID=1538295 RepID=UPI00052DD0AD|nr:hypothetical protein [Aquabacterium sp. NJ1]KGM40838.1 membrane protein [Aquabacterium sp. NJ1]